MVSRMAGAAGLNMGAEKNNRDDETKLGSGEKDTDSRQVG